MAPSHTLYQTSLIAGDSQACYSQAGCVGDMVTAPGPTARDCCAGTDDGESFSENDVNCTISQCVGMYILNHMVIVHVWPLRQRVLMAYS